MPQASSSAILGALTQEAIAKICMSPVQNQKMEHFLIVTITKIVLGCGFPIGPSGAALDIGAAIRLRIVTAADGVVSADTKYVFEIDKVVDVSASGIYEVPEGNTVPVDSIRATQDLTAIEQITRLQMEEAAPGIEGKDRCIDLS